MGAGRAAGPSASASASCSGRADATSVTSATTSVVTSPGWARGTGSGWTVCPQPDSRTAASTSVRMEPLCLHIPLTSFSILMARYKGFLDTAVNGAIAIDGLSDGDKILICEGCTHHRQCDDIGTVKLPRWLEEYTGKKFAYEFTSGGGFPEDLTSYKIIIHCGGCMLNEREIQYRMKCATDQGVPFTNYGTVIALTQGILARSLEIFNQ